jgi:hypothetical protein
MDLKNLGNEEFKKRNFASAISYYTQAISSLSSQGQVDHTLFSNRA